MKVRLVPDAGPPGIDITMPVTTFGTDAGDCDVVLSGTGVCRRHCELLLTSDVVVVRDVSGRESTRVNGQSVNEVRLQAGDTLSIGTVNFRVDIETATRGFVRKPVRGTEVSPRPTTPHVSREAAQRGGRSQSRGKPPARPMHAGEYVADDGADNWDDEDWFQDDWDDEPVDIPPPPPKRSAKSPASRGTRRPVHDPTPADAKPSTRERGRPSRVNRSVQSQPETDERESAKRPAQPRGSGTADSEQTSRRQSARQAEEHDDDDDQDDDERLTLSERFSEFMEEHDLRSKTGWIAIGVVVLALGVWHFATHRWAADRALFEQLTAMQTEINNGRQARLPVNDWVAIRKDLLERAEPMITDLAETATARDRVRQEMLFALRDDLPLVLNEAQGGQMDITNTFNNRIEMVRQMIETKSRSGVSIATKTDPSTILKSEMDRIRKTRGLPPEELSVSGATAPINSTAENEATPQSSGSVVPDRGIAPN